MICLVDFYILNDLIHCIHNHACLKTTGKNRHSDNRMSTKQKNYRSIDNCHAHRVHRHLCKHGHAHSIHGSEWHRQHEPFKAVKQICTNCSVIDNIRKPDHKLPNGSSKGGSLFGIRYRNPTTASMMVRSLFASTYSGLASIRYISWRGTLIIMAACALAVAAASAPVVCALPCTCAMLLSCSGNSPVSLLHKRHFKRAIASSLPCFSYTISLTNTFLRFCKIRIHQRRAFSGIKCPHQGSLTNMIVRTIK